MKAVEEGKNIKELSEYIIDSNTKEPINPEKIYKIANVLKYFEKNQNKEIRALKNISSPTDYTVQLLFKQFFENSNGKIKACYEERIK